MSHSAQKRKQGKPRTPKKDSNHAPSSGSTVAPAPPAPKLSPRAAAFRARRGVVAPQSATFTLSRVQEMMYIREDLRRLVYISGALLILMFVILYVLER